MKITSYYKPRKFRGGRPFIKQSGAFSSRSMASNPPPFVQQPWNKWVFERTTLVDVDGSISTITAGNIIEQIRTKLQLDAGAKIRIKVNNSQIWGTSFGPEFPVPDTETQFFQTSKSSSLRYPRTTMRDVGTINRPSKACYRWPKSDRMDILDTTDASLELVKTLAISKGTKVTSRVNVYWQTGTV